VISAVPEVGWSIRARMLRSVDFPQPEGPMRLTNECPLDPKETPSRAVTDRSLPANTLVSCSTFTVVVMLRPFRSE
jgi:hypothetical protein